MGKGQVQTGDGSGWGEQLPPSLSPSMNIWIQTVAGRWQSGNRRVGTINRPNAILIYQR